MVTIIDYGLGNLGSIRNMLKKVGATAEITSDIERISKATKLILPGVGAFDHGMTNLEELGLMDVLNKKALEEKVPILGICLGMQLFTKSSEEGVKKGLGWIDGETVKFSNEGKGRKFPIPHMGWEYVVQKKESKLLLGMYEEAKFYFVHSYYVRCEHPADCLLGSNYMHDYDSSFEKDNLIGVQFHPEKSHKFGMKLFRNFVENY
jgi:imidazole glycerol-phosphate synthase subunit HisH